MIKPIELGCAGHFIGAGDCHYRRHTQVGNYRVSTIGDYRPLHSNGKRARVGSGISEYFETMVFRTADNADKDNEGCGCREVEDWGDLECKRYTTAGDAHNGHEGLVKAYLKKAKAEAK